MKGFVQLFTGFTGCCGPGLERSVGLKAVEKEVDRIAALLTGSETVLLITGFECHFGYGGSSAVAQIAQDLGLRVIAVVNLPFYFVGKRINSAASDGLNELQKIADYTIVVDNQKLMKIISRDIPFLYAYSIVTELKYHLVQRILSGFNFDDRWTIAQGLNSIIFSNKYCHTGYALDESERTLVFPLREGYHALVVMLKFSQSDDGRIMTHCDSECVEIEDYGYERYFREIDARLLHEDSFGKLWITYNTGTEPYAFVGVVDPQNKRGISRMCFLRVPPLTKTAKEAVAWTFGCSEENYAPELES
jgi:hypothetical protein